MVGCLWWARACLRRTPVSCPPPRPNAPASGAREEQLDICAGHARALAAACAVSSSPLTPAAVRRGRAGAAQRAQHAQHWQHSPLVLAKIHCKTKCQSCLAVSCVQRGSSCCVLLQVRVSAFGSQPPASLLGRTAAHLPQHIMAYHEDDDHVVDVPALLEEFKKSRVHNAKEIVANTKWNEAPLLSSMPSAQRVLRHAARG